MLVVVCIGFSVPEKYPPSASPKWKNWSVGPGIFVLGALAPIAFLDNENKKGSTYQQQHDAQPLHFEVRTE